jgi:hypothetical protein
MSVVIRSSKDGFRRCGEAHSKNPTTWPDDRFSEKELELLLDEPKLSVTITQEAKAPATKEKPIEKNSNNSLSGPEKSLPAATDVGSNQTSDMAPEVLEAVRRAITDGNTIKSGAPDLKAMEQILGRDVDAAERDQAWELVQAEAETKTQDKAEE